MTDFLNRLEMQISKENLQKLQNAHIALFGLGGVGGYCAETLARSGVGKLTIVDKDIIEATNINRQILALHSTLNKDKVQICKDRLLDINPNLFVYPFKIDYPQNNDTIGTNFDYIIDAIDDVNAKIELIKFAKINNIPIISCMGTGNKFDPLKLKIDDINNTHTCPLAKIMRKRLKELHIENVHCLFSTETPIQTNSNIISSNAFVPAVAGILLARFVVLELIK